VFGKLAVKTKLFNRSRPIAAFSFTVIPHISTSPVYGGQAWTKPPNEYIMTGLAESLREVTL